MQEKKFLVFCNNFVFHQKRFVLGWLTLSLCFAERLTQKLPPDLSIKNIETLRLLDPHLDFPMFTMFMISLCQILFSVLDCRASK